MLVSPKLRLFLNYLYNELNGSKTVLGHLIELAITANKVTFPLFMSFAIPNFNQKNISRKFLALTALSIVANTFLPRFRDLIVGQVRHDTQRNITLDMVRSVYQRELDNLLGAPTGACAVIASKNYGSVGQVIPTSFSGILPTIFETIGISSVLTYRYGKIGLVPTVILGSYLVMASLTEQAAASFKEKNSLAMREAFGALLTSINNYQVAHQYGNTEFELQKLNTELAKLESSYNEVQVKSERNSLLLSLFSQLSAVATMAAHIYLSPPKKFSLEDFMTFGYYIYRFSSIIGSLPEKINTLYTGIIDSQLVIDFLNTKSKVIDPEAPQNFKLLEAPSIQFKHVNFKYNSNSQGLQDISFAIKPGQKVAVMGETGSGKSTLLKLMQRFYDFEGEILINNIDIAKVLKADLRACLSVVTQETNLMDDTIHNNIKYGDLSASEQDVQTAANFAGLKFDRARFFSSVRQQGANLSGGEKQRINLARALIKKQTKVFLLDEPTSSLDQQTSQAVLKTLDQLTGTATILMVTHDPYVAVNADHILYLDKGKIVEEGTFEELMAAKKAFYQQVLAQCTKLGVAIEEVKPIKHQSESTELTSWRQQRQ